MGGDKGPQIAINAAIMAIETMPSLHLFLCGDEHIIRRHLASKQISEHPQLTIYPTTDIISQQDKPSVAIRGKKDSSMRKALSLVEQEQAQACVSAGNTGALLGLAHFILKTLPGVERPALISPLPTHDPNKHVFMLDLGANVFCDSHVLYQFALMGAVMAETVDELTAPRVALLNMGEEEVKGSDNIKQAAVQLAHNPDINYVGFVEGNDIFTNKADVIVCDGFVGNVALKTCEGIARLVYQKSKQVFEQHFVARIIGKIVEKSLKRLLKPLNPDQYNGASLVGLRGIVVKSHGNANVTAFYNAILAAVKEVEQQVPQKIKAKLEQGLYQRP